MPDPKFVHALSGQTRLTSGFEEVAAVLFEQRREIAAPFLNELNPYNRQSL